MHGDLYGHNILLNHEGHCLLGDFGAATQYRKLSLEQLEVRAFGCLLEDFLTRLQPDDQDLHASALNQLLEIQKQCVDSSNNNRPLFASMHQLLMR